MLRVLVSWNSAAERLSGIRRSGEGRRLDSCGENGENREHFFPCNFSDQIRNSRDFPALGASCMFASRSDWFIENMR